MDLETVEVNEVEYIYVDDVLNESSGMGLNLPVHMMCTVHSFNLELQHKHFIFLGLFLWILKPKHQTKAKFI